MGSNDDGLPGLFCFCPAGKNPRALSGDADDAGCCCCNDVKDDDETWFEFVRFVISFGVCCVGAAPGKPDCPAAVEVFSDKDVLAVDDESSLLSPIADNDADPDDPGTGDAATEEDVQTTSDKGRLWLDFVCDEVSSEVDAL